MKTQMTITVDTEIKKDFSEFAKSIGSNSSNLANMLFTKVARERRIHFDDTNEGFEAFSQEQDIALSQNKSVQENTKSLESVL